VVARLVRTRRRPEAGAARQEGGLMTGLRSLFADQLLRILVPGLWTFVLVGEAVNVVEVFLITDEIGLGPSGYGAVVAAQGAGAIGGSLAAGALRSDTDRSYAMLAGTVGIGGSCILMGVAPGVVALVVGAVAGGLAVGLLNAATSTLVVTRSAEEVRGRVIAAMTGVTRAFSLLALLLGGLAGAGLGPRATFVLGGLACVLTGLVIAVLVALDSRQMGKDSAEEALSH
jgi:MFS family permease